MNNRPLALKSHMDNVEIIRLCTDYCYCIKIGSDIGPSAVLHPIPILVKITISMADILADPIIFLFFLFIYFYFFSRA